MFRVFESLARPGAEVQFVLPDADVPSASPEKLVLKNASLEYPVLAWADGDGGTQLAWTIQGVSGVFSLSLASFLHARFEDVSSHSESFTSGWE